MGSGVRFDTSMMFSAMKRTVSSALGNLALLSISVLILPLMTSFICIYNNGIHISSVLCLHEAQPQEAPNVEYNDRERDDSYSDCEIVPLFGVGALPYLVRLR